MTTLLIHSAVIFAVLMLLCGLGRLVYVRKVRAPHRHQVHSLTLGLKAWKECAHFLGDVVCGKNSEIARLEQNVGEMAVRIDDLVLRHQLKNAENFQLRGQVEMRIAVIKHLRRVNEALLSERNALAEELLRRTPKGSRRTALQCLKG